jgi:hypothetical protein
MTDTPGVPASIERSFRDLSDAEVADIETTSLLAGMSWRGSFGWEELLRSQRILIVSEAGAGKTYECRTQQERLWRAGDAAFFLDLATLATSSVRDMLSAEEETDIRLRSTSSKQIGTIELKLGDGRSGRDLFKTIKDQLLTKYMAADECRAGCLLVTIAKERNWDHPETGKQINFGQLMRVLNEECERLSLKLGGEVKLMAKGLNLCPRLKTERQTRSKGR